MASQSVGGTPRVGGKKPLSGFGRIYLALYNISVTTIWSYVLFRAYAHVGEQYKTGKSWSNSADGAALWKALGQSIQIAQSLAILDVLHSIVGLVRSPASTVLMQVASRLQLVWLVWHLIPASHEGPWILRCITAWALSEIMRYPFYAVSLYCTPPALLQWIRYSGFVVLYPVGIFCEVMCIYRSLPTLQTNPMLRHFPYAMPNRFNFQMDLYVTFLIVLMLYVPGTVHLYGYMLKQRRKALQKTDDKKQQ